MKAANNPDLNGACTISCRCQPEVSNLERNQWTVTGISWAKRKKTKPSLGQAASVIYTLESKKSNRWRCLRTYDDRDLG
jgi:hypothetical protein